VGVLNPAALAQLVAVLRRAASGALQAQDFSLLSLWKTVARQPGRGAPLWRRIRLLLPLVSPLVRTSEVEDSGALRPRRAFVLLANLSPLP